MHSLAAISTALLACATSVAATKFSVVETYDKTNYLQKFDFFESWKTENTQDPANGDVWYVAEPEATKLKLIGEDGDDFFVKPDVKSTDIRRSIRLESKKSYTQGLMVARFTHFPKPACGLWPAFWTKGSDWPNQGEIDIYEHWNLEANNQPALHTGNSGDHGNCLVDQTGVTGKVLTDNCDNTFANNVTQYLNQGCSANAGNAPYGSSNGGIYALEWTGDSMSIYGFSYGSEPANVHDSHPDTATWGEPIMRVNNNQCDLNRHFGPQKIVLNIDFCGEPAKFPWVWNPTCGEQTKVATCTEFVKSHPEAFQDSYFKVKDIRFFQDSRLDPVSTSSAAVSSTSTVASSSSSAAPVSSTESSSAVVSSVASSSAAASSSEAVSSAAVSSSAAASETVASSSAAVSSSASNQVSSAVESSSASQQVSTVGASSTAGSQSASGVTQSNTASATGVASASDASSVISSSTRWSNSSASATSVEMTTSTVYTTRPVTVTSCAPTVTNCPIGKVTTETVALYTTVCPVSKGSKPSATPSKPAGGNDNETITTHITTTYTITSCAPTVTNCPVGKVTTEVITTTYCPGEETPKQTGGNVKPSQSVGVVPGWNNSTRTFVATPSATGGYYPGSDNGCTGANCPGNGNKQPEGCNGENCPPVIVSGGARVAVSAIAAVVGLVALAL